MITHTILFHASASAQTLVVEREHGGSTWAGFHLAMPRSINELVLGENYGVRVNLFHDDLCITTLL
jgi:hypothetical protein